MPRTVSKNPVVTYYRTKESLWGYNLILNGVKHFGYYPKGLENISIAEAQNLMSLEIGKRLKISMNSIVLDAGCGEGPVSVSLAKKYNCNVEGVDILDFNINNANIRAQKAGVGDKVHFQIGDYSKLNFPKNHFDCVFMIETFVHAPNYKIVLSEILRVLKPKGRLVIVEYTKAQDEDLKVNQRKILNDIIKFSSMPSFKYFLNDKFSDILTESGFVEVTTENISERIVPMTRKLYNIAVVPYQLIRLFHLQNHFVNTMWGYYHYPYNKIGIWRYNMTTCQKP